MHTLLLGLSIAHPSEKGGYNDGSLYDNDKKIALDLKSQIEQTDKEIDIVEKS